MIRLMRTNDGAMQRNGATNEDYSKCAPAHTETGELKINSEDDACEILFPFRSHENDHPSYAGAHTSQDQ